MSDPARGTDYLSLEDLLDLVNALGAGPVRDLGLLDSACHRPRAGLFGQEAYPRLSAKAAALMHSLAGNPSDLPKVRQAMGVAGFCAKSFRFCFARRMRPRFEPSHRLP